MTSPLSPSAVDVLRAATATETTVDLPDVQLDRKVYEEVNKALTRIGGGGKWNRSRKVHVFPRDPRPELAALVGSGEMPADEKKTSGFFATPPAIADLAARPVFRAYLTTTGPFRVLEPSAGDGALAAALTPDMAPMELTLIEPNSDRHSNLFTRWGGLESVSLHEETFEEFAEWHGTDGVFDAVLMNPPFSLPGRPVAWAEHVAMAWEMLAASGVLSAIIPDSLNRIHRLIAPVKRIANLGTVEKLPAGAFKESGTGVNTALLVATKPAVAS